MNTRTALNRIGICALTAYLAASQPLNAGTPAVEGHAKAAAIAPPAVHVKPKLGAAPKTDFKVNNHSFRIDPKEKAVQAVRAMPPRNYEPTVRKASVDGFYKKQFAEKHPVREKLANLYVGPFRREFIWWAWHGWAAEDRAAWAWNNYSYFEPTLWNQWMEDEDFKRRIGKYEAEKHPRVPGFVPQQYIASAPEVIYNDEYIEAVYNPVYTTPSIVVDGSAGARLENLIQGAPRTFGTQSTTIDSLADSTTGLQFISLPAKFDPTYQIEVKRDGVLYIFGPKKTVLQDGVGDDAPKWASASNLIAGSGIQAIYQRKVAAGEKIRLHGYEWSIASEQIDVLSAASPAATTAVTLVDAEIGQMLKSDGGILQAKPELKDYLRIAQGAEQGLVTPLGNVDENKIGLYYAALDKTQQMAADAIAQSSAHKLVASAKELSRQVKGLEDSLNAVDELRNPDGPSPDASPAESPASSITQTTRMPASTAEQLRQIKNSIGMTMAPIKAGSFNMGSPDTEPGRHEDESLHRVTLTKSFFMGATDVTIGQFAQFEAAAGYKTASEKSGFGNVYDTATKQWGRTSGLSFRNPGYEHTDDFPAVFVSTFDARAFCEWLSTKENRHYRLPTEAEWEYACRAGTTSAFNTGDGNAAFASAGWTDQKGHAVAQKQPNAWGIYDMLGNVRQWCSDWYAPYPTTDTTDPVGGAEGNAYVSRGGDAWKKPNGCRSAVRSHLDHPKWSDVSIGFRVVMDSTSTATTDATFKRQQ